MTAQALNTKSEKPAPSYQKEIPAKLAAKAKVAEGAAAAAALAKSEHEADAAKETKATDKPATKKP